MKSNADTENIKPSARKRRPKSPKRVTADWLRNSGLYYLQRFAASTEHFRTVMTRKIDLSCRAHADQDRDECMRMLDSLIIDLHRQGLLNDQAYAEGAVLSLRRRGLSRRAITTRLQAKGLDADTIRRFVEKHDREQGGSDPEGSNPEDGDLRAALRLAQRRRIGPYCPPDKIIDRDKAIAALGRAGFSYDLARRVVDMGPDDLADLL